MNHGLGDVVSRGGAALKESHLAVLEGSEEIFEESQSKLEIVRTKCSIRKTTLPSSETDLCEFLAHFPLHLSFRRLVGLVSQKHDGNVVPSALLQTETHVKIIQR